MQLRDGNSARYPHKWCFPGGRIEPGESVMEALLREVKEEYELEIEPADCTQFMLHKLSYGSSSAIFLCLYNKTKEPVCNEGADMKWMSLEEIKKLELGFEQERVLLNLEKLLKS